MDNFEYILVLPVICLAAFGLGALLLAPWFRGNSRYIGLVSITGLVMSGACLVQLWNQWSVTGPRETAFGLVRIDGFGLFISLVLILVGLLSVLYSMTFLEREEADQGVHSG